MEEFITICRKGKKGRKRKGDEREKWRKSCMTKGRLKKRNERKWCEKLNEK